jgi:hypothetical protein
MSTFNFQRHIPIDKPYDLVVAGGGPAGTAAAVCAARLGAKVLLIEATGCAGGMGTSGLVTAFDPMANGEQCLVGGFMNEVVETMYQRGFLMPDIDPDTWRKHFHRWTPFNAEGLKLVLDEKFCEAGVEVRYFSKVVDCDMASPTKLAGVVIHNIEGFRYVPAKCFVDATGDAVLADLAKVPCREAGRDTKHIMPCTLPSLFTGIDFSKTTYNQVQDLYHQALDDGLFSQYDRHLPGMSKVGNQVGYLNGGHMFNLNALRVGSMTEGVMLGRRLAQEFLAFFKARVPGYENLEHVTTASLIGVRESRRIVGEYELTKADYLARRQFPDQIGVFNKFIDIHVYDCSDAQWQRFSEEHVHSGRLNPGECFGIPYSILVPRGFENLWVAGRCVSTDVPVHGSIRVQPAASMMGQAAGTAAVQAIRQGQRACDLDTQMLINTLRDAKAYLPQVALSKVMTR